MKNAFIYKSISLTVLLVAYSFVVNQLVVRAQGAVGGNTPRLFDQSDFTGADRQSARLDYFWRELEKQPQSKGYIIGYNEKNFPRGRFLRRIYGSKSYLERSWAKDSDRITVIDGGYRDQLTVELWIAPEGTAPPTPITTKAVFDNEPPVKFDSECISCEPSVFVDLPILENGLAYYAEALRLKPNSRALIVYYPTANERDVLKSARNMLSKRYEIDVKRIRTKVGKNRSPSTLELWIKN